MPVLGMPSNGSFLPGLDKWLLMYGQILPLFHKQIQGNLEGESSNYLSEVRNPFKMESTTALHSDGKIARTPF